MGAPTKLTDKVASEICERLASGDSLKQICLTKGMPSERSVFNWLLKDADFLQQYTRARERQADAFAEQLVQIAEDESIPVDRARLQVDTKKWIMARVAAKKYGDKIEQQMSGNLTIVAPIPRSSLDKCNT